MEEQQGIAFGRFVFEARQARGWSLRVAAKATGIGHTRLDEIEKSVGRHARMATRPTMEQVVQLAHAYEVPVHELLALAGFEPLFELNEKEREAVLKLRSSAKSGATDASA